MPDRGPAPPETAHPAGPNDLGSGGRSSLFSARPDPGARRLEERDESHMDRLKPREANRLYPLSSVFSKLDTHGVSYRRSPMLKAL